MSTTARRPLKSRSSAGIRAFAARLAARRVAPNAISAASVGFAVVSAAALLLVGPVDGALAEAGLLLAAAAGIQLRLLCNLLDGLVAVEGGLKTPDGELFNEVPDRISDSLVLAAAGYAAGVPELGWAAALAAVLTAYVRALGGSLGLAQDFGGPMAKPQRMALMTVACLGAALGPEEPVLTVALAVVAAGSLVTCVVRLARVRSGLRAR